LVKGDGCLNALNNEFLQRTAHPHDCLLPVLTVGNQFCDKGVIVSRDEPA
jgi:hypothetical protein